MAEKGYREFLLTEEIKECGINRVYAFGKMLFLKNSSDTLQCEFHRKDLQKTMDGLKQVLITHFDEKTTQKILLHIADQWVKSEPNTLNKDEDKRSASDKKRAEDIARILEDIKQVKIANSDISQEEWLSGLTKRYTHLHEVVKENMPELWIGLEFALSVMRILNIDKNTLPFIGLLLARPSSYKTVILNRIKKWYCAYYTDDFSPKAWVSHAQVKDVKELDRIDMLPMCKNRILLTPELAPFFATKEEDLTKIIGLIIRIADGNGLLSNSGLHGQRGYDEDMMFTWVGATVDIHYKVYKILSNLGFKMYFFRLPHTELSEDQLLEAMDEDFNENLTNIDAALYEYLTWFEIGPELTFDESAKLSKMKWRKDKDNKDAKRWIVKLGNVLKHLRCIV